MANTTEDQIKQMYGAQLASQKAQLTNSYNDANAKLDYQQEQAQKNADRNINLTKVENQKAAVNNAEYYAAAGLSSGAKAQARLAQDNQLQADVAAIRAAQQAADAEAERQRSLLAKEYTLAIQKAQADNDMSLAKALYEEAKNAEKALLAKEEAAAKLMAESGDFTRLAALYGLSDEEVAKLYGKDPEPALTRDEVTAGYFAKLSAGATQRELDDYLRSMVAQKYLTMQEATQIRDNRGGLAGRPGAATPGGTKPNLPSLSGVYAPGRGSGTGTAGSAIMGKNAVNNNRTLR